MKLTILTKPNGAPSSHVHIAHRQAEGMGWEEGACQARALISSVQEIWGRGLAGRFLRARPDGDGTAGIATKEVDEWSVDYIRRSSFTFGSLSSPPSAPFLLPTLWRYFLSH